MNTQQTVSQHLQIAENENMREKDSLPEQESEPCLTIMCLTAYTKTDHLH